MTKITYTCFYTNKPFWSIERPDLDDLGFQSNFTNRMSEIVFEERIDDLQLRIARDGLIELRDQSLEDRITAERDHGALQTTVEIWSEYLMLANCVYLLLDMATISRQNFAFFDFQEITRKDAFRMTYENGRFSSSGHPIESIAGSFCMGRYLSDYRPGVPLSIDTRISFRQVIEEDTLKLLAHELSQVLQAKELLEKFYTLSKSMSEYKVGNYKACIVLCWFVIEERLNELYSGFLDEKNCMHGERKRINHERMKFLTGRDFTASIVSNILELCNIITFDNFDRVDKVRRLRNDIAHGLNKMEIGSDDCSDALKLACDLLLGNTLSSTKLNLSLSSQGL